MHPSATWTQRPAQDGSASAASIASWILSVRAPGPSRGPRKRRPSSTSHVHAHPAGGAEKSRRASFMRASWPRLSRSRGLARASRRRAATRAQRRWAAQCSAEKPSASERPLTSARASRSSSHIGRSPALAATMRGVSRVLGSARPGSARSRSRSHLQRSTSPAATAPWNSGAEEGSSRSAARWSSEPATSMRLGRSAASSSSTRSRAARARSRASASAPLGCSSSPPGRRSASRSRRRAASSSRSPRRRSSSSAPQAAASSSASSRGCSTGASRSQGRALRLGSTGASRASQKRRALSGAPGAAPAVRSALPCATAVTSRSVARRRARVVSSRLPVSRFRTRDAHSSLAQSGLSRKLASPRAQRRACARLRSW
mmetsp:Transcript_31573/g.98429  ORF Transcript_31573/g.98429 Transcript_31573/m.98429 type:complete len:374 (+) Transcript_31573:604-1725(+)